MKKIGILIFTGALILGIGLAGIFSFGKTTGRIFNFSAGFGGERGSGNIVTEKREVSDFKKVDVSGIYIVEITAQKDYSVEVEADDNLLQFINTEVDGDTLKIESSGKIFTSNSLKIKISAPNIENLQLSGASKATIVNIDNDSLDIDSSGAAKISCEGKTDNLRVHISGASHFDGAKTSAKNVSVDANGASHATVLVTDKLKADLSGASKLIYFGNPTDIEKKTSGVSSIVGK